MAVGKYSNIFDISGMSTGLPRLAPIDFKPEFLGYPPANSCFMDSNLSARSQAFTLHSKPSQQSSNDGNN